MIQYVVNIRHHEVLQGAEVNQHTFIRSIVLLNDRTLAYSSHLVAVTVYVVTLAFVPRHTVPCVKLNTLAYPSPMSNRHLTPGTVVTVFQYSASAYFVLSVTPAM